MRIKKIQIWDLPLRLFHWLLVVAVAGAYVTAELGGNLTDWHGRIGALALGLITFRLVWGFAGTTHARFSSFAPTPARLIAYSKGNWQAHGHNPLGALSVFALLAALGWLVGTGLFANDDIGFQGPLFYLISKDSSDQLTAWHGLAFDWLAGLISLHLAAIAYYGLVKKTNLITPMITGKKAISQAEITAAESKPVTSTAKQVIAVVFAIGIAAVIVWLIFGGAVTAWLSPPPVAAAPGW